MDVTWKRVQGHVCHLGDPILPDLKLGAAGLAGSGAFVSQRPTAAGINGTSSAWGLDFPQDSPICFCFHSGTEDLRKVLSCFFFSTFYVLCLLPLSAASQPGSPFASVFQKISGKFPSENHKSQQLRGFRQVKS